MSDVIAGVSKSTHTFVVDLLLPKVWDACEELQIFIQDSKDVLWSEVSILRAQRIEYVREITHLPPGCIYYLCKTTGRGEILFYCCRNTGCGKILFWEHAYRR